ncbi:NAD(P)H:quinone oxidoreductase [Rheinheimera sp. 1928-s]|uniref:NAD(P)H:quinone oxidoreductase n=1 Tax=Rheinheimera sp. 1928-s TaxID=3033803 RepID=UPI002639EB49|nr:NAD(P)H:quinone oxidoreductase [Rheinheimera sp. 1928-s]MDF3125614.1 NAD(P)H:quinone oxidoreductase [Rheinheimera sp. 1928-s]
MSVQLLILYYSRHGSVAALAEKIAIGAQQAGADVILRTVPALDGSAVGMHPHVTEQDLLAADGFAFGSPVRFGNMAAPLKAFWDNTSSLWLKGALMDKPAGVFTSSGSMHGGNEANLLSMMLPLLHHGMLIVGLPYLEPELHHTQTGGTPYGPSHVSGLSGSDKLSKDEHQLAVQFGKRLALAAIALKTSGFSTL